MAEKKKVFINFEKSKYIDGKSELLKIQMECLYLKKLIRNLLLTRTKKTQYRQRLEEMIFSLRKSITKLDSMVPIDNEFEQWKGTDRPSSDNSYQKKKEARDIKKSSNSLFFVKKEEIEEELIRIKQKLDLLNKE